MKRTLATIGAAALIALGLAVVPATAASAHDAALTGTATCQKDGTYTVVWTGTLTNVPEDHHEVDIKVIKHAPAGSLINGSDGQVWLYEWAEHKANHNLPAYPTNGVFTYTQTKIPGTATTATSGYQFDFKGGPSGDPEKTIDLPGNCTPPTTPPTTEPPTKLIEVEGKVKFKPAYCYEEGQTNGVIILGPGSKHLVYKIERNKDTPHFVFSINFANGFTAVSAKKTGDYTVTILSAQRDKYVVVGQKVWTYTYVDVDLHCPVPTHKPKPTKTPIPVTPVVHEAGPGELAHTGLDDRWSAPLLVGALGILALGVGGVIYSKRKGANGRV